MWPNPQETFLCSVMCIMTGIKEVKHFTKTASSDSKSEDLHDGLTYFIRTPNKIYVSFKERMEILPLNQIIWTI